MVAITWKGPGRSLESEKELDITQKIEQTEKTDMTDEKDKRDK